MATRVIVTSCARLLMVANLYPLYLSGVTYSPCNGVTRGLAAPTGFHEVFRSASIGYVGLYF